MLIDLSHPLFDGMPVYPGDSPVDIHQVRFFETDGYTQFATCIGQHAGTHVDAPMHLSADRTPIGQFPLDCFCGEAWVFDVRGLSVIDIPDVDLNRLPTAGIALFCTGMDVDFGSEAYFKRHPVLSEALADALVRRGVKLVGVDMPSPDHPPFPVHRKLFAAQVPLVENLTRLEALAGRPGIRFYGFPLALSAEGSLIRAVAELC